MTLDALNVAPRDAVMQALLSCSGSTQWVAQLLARRPWTSENHLQSEAEQVWFSLSAQDWLEAFSAHPKIGERSSDRWSAQEQNGMAQARQATTEAIQRMNTAYERRFGYIFIICATGKTAEEMRDALAQRLSHQPEDELSIAAIEQAKIMHLRLKKLLAA